MSPRSIVKAYERRLYLRTQHIIEGLIRPSAMTPSELARLTALATAAGCTATEYQERRFARVAARMLPAVPS